MSQARILEWVAFSSSRGSSPPRDRTCISCISCIGRQILYHWTTWEARKHENLPLNINKQELPSTSEEWAAGLQAFWLLGHEEGSPREKYTPPSPLMGWPPESHWSTPSPSITCYVLSLGCHHKWEQTDFVAWNGRSSFSPWSPQSKWWQDRIPSEGSRGEPHLASSSFWWVQVSSAGDDITLISAPIFLLCVYALSFSKHACHWT